MRHSSVQKIGNIAFLLLFIFNILVGGVHHILHSEEFFHTENHHHDFHKSDKHYCENEAKFDCDLDLFIHHKDFFSLDAHYFLDVPLEIITHLKPEVLVSILQTHFQASFLRGPPILQ